MVLGGYDEIITSRDVLSPSSLQIVYVKNDKGYLPFVLGKMPAPFPLWWLITTPEFTPWFIVGSCSSILSCCCSVLTTIVCRFVPFSSVNCNVCPSIYSYHFQRQESGRVMYFYVKGISIAFFTILISDFGIVTTLWYFYYCCIASFVSSDSLYFYQLTYFDFLWWQKSVTILPRVQ